MENIHEDSNQSMITTVSAGADVSLVSATPITSTPVSITMPQYRNMNHAIIREVFQVNIIELKKKNIIYNEIIMVVYLF